MDNDNANMKCDHVYAIVRLDPDTRSETLPDRQSVTVKKIVTSIEEAEREVARLSQLNADKGCVYFWQVTRIDRGVLPFDCQDQSSRQPAETAAKR